LLILFICLGSIFIYQIFSSPESRRLYDCWLREQLFRDNKELIGQEIYISLNNLTDFCQEELCRCGGTFEELTLEKFNLIEDYALVILFLKSFLLFF